MTKWRCDCGHILLDEQALHAHQARRIGGTAHKVATEIITLPATNWFYSQPGFHTFMRSKP